MDLIIKMAPGAAQPTSAEYRCVEDQAAAFGFSIQPLHPSTTDPELATFYVAEVDPSAVDVVVRRLLACDGVEGAYGKPAGEPPGD